MSGVVSYKQSMDQKTAREKILQWTAQNNEVAKADRQSQYADAMASNDTGETFEEYFEDVTLYLKWYNDVANDADIAKLENASERLFPDVLKDYWKTLGGPSGIVVDQDLNLCPQTVANLLSGFAEEARPYQKIHSLGLIHMMGWVWDNDKEFMNVNPDEQLIPRIAAANENYTCFGFLGDGYCEGFMFLHFDKDENFGATYWHQDYDLPEEPAYNKARSPEELIMLCLEGYNAIRAKDPEDPYFSNGYLETWLKEQ